jgi:hypothetical protein
MLQKLDEHLTAATCERIGVGQRQSWPMTPLISLTEEEACTAVAEAHQSRGRRLRWKLAQCRCVKEPAREARVAANKLPLIKPVGR